MPRKSRIDAAGALHHVMVRGIERGAVSHGAKTEVSIPSVIESVARGQRIAEGRGLLLKKT